MVLDEYSKEIFKMFRGKCKKLEDIETIEKAISEGQSISEKRKEKIN